MDGARAIKIAGLEVLEQALSFGDMTGFLDAKMSNAEILERVVEHLRVNAEPPSSTPVNYVYLDRVAEWINDARAHNSLANALMEECEGLLPDVVALATNRKNVDKQLSEIRAIAIRKVARYLDVECYYKDIR